MASGEPSPSFMKQIQLTICQLCGQDMNSPGNQTHAVNYQKQVDPPAMPYKQYIPDYRYDELEEAEKRKKGKSAQPGKSAPLQVCISIPVVSGKSQPGASPPGKTGTAPSPSASPHPPSSAPASKPEDSGTTTKDQARTGGTASCLPVGGSGCPQPVKMMLCLPCPPPECVSSSASGSSNPTQCTKSKPKDYTYRCESRELRGGNLYQCCQCNKRNGLQHDCPRTPCQGRPACLAKPWPDCWPSGGCHGIDYSREKGVKRIDPCRESRFDKKECKPPGGAAGSGGSGNSGNCGGNMMVVVCPAPSGSC